ncbi:MAG: cardiolipin synthase B [Herminiimonas sp.]|nr:cardiolipin synthase B [Herminiimonas sp.]
MPLQLRTPRSKFGKLIVIVASVGATLFAVLLVANFSTGEKRVVQDIPRLYPVADMQFQRSMGVMLGPNIVGGNKIETLLNGDQIFPSMLKAIREARHSINLETYIYWSEQIGLDMADALAERARAGVKVHVLIDWVGSSKLDAEPITKMKDAGVEFEKYHPLRWYTLGRLNNRTHRKLMIVDGNIGFTGGVGIAAIWTGRAQDPDHWRDSHFRIEGPVVAQMQAVFMDNWIKTTGRVLHGPIYFPALAPAGNLAAQTFSSSPSGGNESMHLMYMLAFTAAQKSIYISSAYFVPDERTRETLIDAMKRGVKLKIIMPGPHTDADTVRSSSRGMWGELLQAGAELYEYQPTMYHCKVMIVDGLMTSVGSTNFDDRSMRLNDEANVNVYDAEFAQRQTAIFDEDIAKSQRITFAKWNARPWQEKLWERVASHLGPLL